MKEPDFAITRIFDAPRELVFRAWTEQQYIVRWWGPHGFTAPICKIDFRVGGSFHYRMRSPDGKEYWTKGTYQEIVVPEKIVSTMYLSDASGNLVAPSEYGLGPDFPSEMLDIVTFDIHEGDKTKLTLRRNHATSIATRYQEDQGWSQSLDRLAEIITAM
jgi:uncharacterized protein YndB with AHSA1/START domain